MAHLAYLRTLLNNSDNDRLVRAFPTRTRITVHVARYVSTDSWEIDGFSLNLTFPPGCVYNFFVLITHELSEGIVVVLACLFSCLNVEPTSPPVS